MSEKETMEVFLREMLMNIENEQSQIIRELEESHRKVESLNREKIIIEEKLKDNISFFHPSSAKNREKLDEVNKKIVVGFEKIERTKNNLQKINDKIIIMGRILNFIHDHMKEEEEKSNLLKNGVSILEAQEVERKRIARDLHDSTVQSLTNIVHKTEYCSKMIEKDPMQVKLELISMMGNIRNSIDDMRRIIYDLRPMSIDDLGLVPTVQRFVEKNRQLYEDIQLDISVQAENKEIKTPSVVTLTLFRVIQEACNNIFKYANAKHVNINICEDEQGLEIVIADDGVGFNMFHVKHINKNSKSNSGFGLSIMKERTQLLGGTFRVETEPNIGTKIIVFIPKDVIQSIAEQRGE